MEKSGSFRNISRFLEALAAFPLMVEIGLMFEREPVDAPAELSLLGARLYLGQRQLPVAGGDLVGHGPARSHLEFVVTGHGRPALLEELTFEDLSRRDLPGHDAHRLILHRIEVTEVVYPAVVTLDDSPEPGAEF